MKHTINFIHFVALPYFGGFCMGVLLWYLDKQAWENHPVAWGAIAILLILAIVSPMWSILFFWGPSEDEAAG